MTFKNILIVILLIGAAVGIYLTAKANKEIKRITTEADSAVAVRDSAYKRRVEESRILQDSIRFYEQKSADDGRRASTLRQSNSRLKSQLAQATQPAESLAIYPRLVDSLETEIAALIRKGESDSNRIRLLIIDRDEWQWEADSLRNEMLRQNTRIHEIAVVAERKVNFGILTVPERVVWGVVGVGIGAGIGYVAGNSN